MRAVIAEDEPLARELLRTLLASSGVEVVGEASDGVQAVALLDRLEPDVLFLDIDMPGRDGLSAGIELQGCSSAQIVFVTAHEPHAVDAFELGATDYVLKPVRRLRLAKALERVRERMQQQRAAAGNGGLAADEDAAFWVRAHQATVRVQISDIVWIEAARDHVYFHTPERSYLHRITMEELEAKLGATGMLRVQRSAFVKIDRVRAILRKGKSVLLELDDRTQVSVGPSYRARTLETLAARGLEHAEAGAERQRAS